MSFVGGKMTTKHHVLCARWLGSDHDPLTFLHQGRKGGELSSRNTTQSPRISSCGNVRPQERWLAPFQRDPLFLEFYPPSGQEVWQL